MNKVDVLIVNPPSPDGALYIRDICRWGRKSREGMVWPQTSLAYLAAMVPEEMKVEIIDAIAEKMKWPAFEKKLRDKNPCIYLSYVTGTTMEVDAKGIKLAHELGALTLAIGTHPSAVPEDTMERIPELDIVIRHEPEMTFQEILKIWKTGGRPDHCEGTAVRGENGHIIVHQDRPLLKHLDELPFPKHDLLPLDKYRMPFLGKRYIWVLTNRGCPYNCSFCFESVVWGKSVRYRSPESIFRELVRLNKLNVHNILFMADLFTFNRKGVLSLCDLIINSGLKIKWVCNSRVDTIDEEMTQKMKNAGCRLIAFGIESGSQQVLDACRKNVSVETAYKTINMVRRIGIKTWGYFILGLPQENKNTINATIQLALSLPLDLALFHIAVPYPGTDFYQQALDNGWLATKDWIDFDMNDSAVLKYPDLKTEELLKATKKAYRKFYLRPRQMGRLVWMITSGKDIFMLTQIAGSLFRWVFSRKKP